tara:strand:+ start:394 stop:993 length:600 start_codon:yes stop_codon:yes gene_type:complete
MIIIDNNIWPREYTIQEFKLQHPNIPQKDIITFYKVKHKQFVDDQYQQLKQREAILEYEQRCTEINLENPWLCGTESSPGGSYTKPKIRDEKTEVTNETGADEGDGQIEWWIDMGGAVNEGGMSQEDSPYYFQLFNEAGDHLSTGNGNDPPDNIITQNEFNVTWTNLHDGVYYMNIYDKKLPGDSSIIATTDIQTVGTD